MDLQNDFDKNKIKKKPVSETDSLRERYQVSHMIRKKQVRTRIILLNAAIALIVIMIMLVFEVTALNKEPATSQNAAETSSQKDAKKNSDKKDENTVADSDENTGNATEKSNGQWIRKNLDASKPMVALTFDDGPNGMVTKKIIATLNKYHQKATFFCVCNRIPKYNNADVVKRAYVSGNQIASHTYGHVILTSLKSPNSIRQQVTQANQVIQDVIGCEPTVLRPPGGFVNDKVKKSVDLPLIGWSIDTEDWKSRNCHKILLKCQSIEDGDIVLMHDLYPTTAQAVAKLVPRLVKKGYQLVTIDELFYYKKIRLENGKIYYNGK